MEKFMIGITSNPLEDKIYDALEPSFRTIGYDIVRIQVRGNERPTLEILIDRTDGAPVSLDDCVAASHQASAVLDVEDPLEKAYSLEVFSPGLERPLTRDGDFDRYKGHHVRLKTDVAIDGRKRFSGQLIEVSEAEIVLKMADADTPVPITKENINQANLCINFADVDAKTKETAD